MEGSSKSMTSSKKAKVEEGQLNFLPEDIRCRIMSFMPTHEAFKTTLLTRMWRTMWASYPVLIFDYRTFPNVDNKLNHFLDFIRHTVANHDETNLKTFSLCFLPLRDCYAPIDNEWVTFAVQHNAQIITLCGNLEEHQRLPDILFTSDSIVKLALSVNIVLEWPVGAKLRNLKSLVLVDTYLSAEFTLDFSEICPQIENLLLLFCDVSAFRVFSIKGSRLKHVEISRCLGIELCEFVQLLTPSLERLEYTGAVARDYRFGQMDSLSVAKITILSLYPAQTRDVCYPSAVKLARGVRRAKCLLFNNLFIKFIKDERPPRLLRNMLFHKLETMILCMVPTREQLLTIFLLLSRCPELSNLCIAIARPLEPSQDMLNQAKLEIPCLLNRLRSIKIADFRGNESEMELVKVFLQSCPSLLELKITMAGQSNDPDPEMLQLTANQKKVKILEMLKLALSSSLIVSFS